jgi:hypothetical protein
LLSRECQALARRASPFAEVSIMRVVSFRNRQSVTRIVIAVAILFVTGSSAAAQERLFGVFQDRLIELDATPGRLGRPVASVDVGSFDGDFFPVAGGRLLAFTRAPFLGTFPVRHHLHVVDLRTGAIRELPVGTFTGPIVASDPGGPRLYIRDAEAYSPTGGYTGHRVAVVDLSQMTTSYFPLTVEPFRSVAVHPPSGPMFLTTGGGFIGAAITILDPRTGATRTITTETNISNMAVDPGGSRVYVTGGGPNGRGISSYDLATGALLASHIVRDANWDLETVTLDPTRNRVLVTNGTFPRLVGVLNAGTLAVEAVVPLSVLAGVPTPPMGTVSPQFEYGGRPDALYLATTNEFHPGSNQPGSHMCHTVLTRLDATSGAVGERADVTALMGRDNFCANSLIIVRAPEPPVASGVTMSGAVDITWTDPGNATHFELEAGTAPGLRNIGVFQVAGTRFLVQNAPPGRYHVRVRAINDVGRSLPSNEVVIVVP